MAKKHKPPLSGKPPVVTGSFPQPTTVNGHLRPDVYGGPLVTIASADPAITVQARLRGPISRPLPQPRYDIVDRPARVSVLHWQGREPYEMVAPLRFDRRGAGGSIEPELRDLLRLALRHGGDQSPPVVTLAGPVPDAPGSSGKWCITDMTEVDSDTQSTVRGDGRWSRVAVDVTFTEHAANDRLEAATGAGGKGIKNRRATIHKGETLFHFAKRVLHDRGKADEVARANSLRLSYVAKADGKLRLP